MLSIAERVQLIQRNTEEIIGANEIAALLEQDIPLRHYIGLEISGKIHLGTGLMCMQKVRDLQMAGVQCTIFLADWHTWLNEKLGGDRERIKEVAEKYFKKGLKASLKAIGGNPDKLDFILGSDLYHNNDRYWEQLVQVSKNVTLSRIERSISIMGRSEGDATQFAMLIYPPMQVTDIFALQANFAHGGLDQRKAHVIARDVALNLDILPLKDRHAKTIKPIIVHHHLLLGLDKPPTWPLPADPEEIRAMRTAMKMSKSKPNSAVFIHDTPDEIRKKIRKAFCPPEIEYNPVLDWVEHLVFHNDMQFFVARKEENGGDVTYATFEELKAAYTSGALHPGDLKNATAEALIKIMEPIRAAFEGDNEANAIWQGM
ncbi:MAG: tyrosine--tRNA ligase [Anaerolineae bacterium]|nr:tyrosine--tRNA ligase [Anaerolineae bacterium]